MSITSDIAGDHVHIEGVETVTFTPQNPAQAALATVKGKRMSPTKGDLALLGGLALNEETAVWHLWNATMGSYAPKPLDLITQGTGEIWAVRMAPRLTLDTRWRCLAVRRKP